MKITDRKNIDLFPEELRVQILAFREAQQPLSMGVVMKFAEYREGLVEDAESVTAVRYSNSVKIFLAQTLQATDDFRESTKLASFVRKYVQERGLSKASVISYLSTLSTFLDFLDVHCRKTFPHINDVSWQKVLKEIRIPFQKSAHKEKRKMQKQKFSKVPSFQEVQLLYKRVMEKLNEDSELKNLTYKDLMVFNMFILTVRINCRSGPLLSLSWDDVDKIKEFGFIETDRHKTGVAYDVSIIIEPEQISWLDRLKEQHFAEFGVNSSMVFPSSTNGMEHSYARFLRQVLLQHFPDVSHEKDFHSNSLRKMWDTYMDKNRELIPDSLRRMHLKQTGHSESTSRSNYLVPGDCNPIVQLYSSYLSSNASSVDEGAPNESLARVPVDVKTPENKSKRKASTPCGNSSSKAKCSTSNDLRTPFSATKKKTTPLQGTPDNETKIEKVRRAETDFGQQKSKTSNRKRKCLSYLESSDEETADCSKDAEWKPPEASEDEISGSHSSYSFCSSSTVRSVRSNLERSMFVKSLQTFRTYNPTTAEKELMKRFHNFEGKFSKQTFDRIVGDISETLTKQQLNRSYQKIKFAVNQYL